MKKWGSKNIPWYPLDKVGVSWPLDPVLPRSMPQNDSCRQWFKYSCQGLSKSVKRKWPDRCVVFIK